MKNIILFSLLGIGIQLSLFSQKKYIAVFQSDSYTVDGKPDNWPKKLTHEPSLPLDFEISHDGDFLYFSIKIENPDIQNFYLLTGLQLSLSASANRKLVKTICYPLGFLKSDLPRTPDRLIEVLRELQFRKNALVESYTHLELVGFRGKTDTILRENVLEGGISAMMGINNAGIIFYEAAIPISTFTDTPTDYSVNGKRHFQVEITSGALGRPIIRGDMGVGISGTAASNPSQTETRYSRDVQRLLELYRSYTVPLKIKLKKVKLSKIP